MYQGIAVPILDNLILRLPRCATPSRREARFVEGYPQESYPQESYPQIAQISQMQHKMDDPAVRLDELQRLLVLSVTFRASIGVICGYGRASRAVHFTTK